MYVILCISMMPLIANGYSMYVLVVLFPYIFARKFNSGSFLVLLFSIFYTLSFIIRGEEIEQSKLVFYSLFPLIIYSCGNVLVARLRDTKTVLFVLVSLVACLAIPGIFLSVKDFLNSGELVKLNRAVEYSDGQVLSATVYGMMFSCAIAGIGMIVYPAVSKFDKKLKRFLVVLSILALLGTVHILNRTGLFLGGIAIITVLVIPPYNTKRLTYSLLIFAVLALFVFYYLADTVLMNDAIQGYLLREEESEYSTATGGGRFGRWGDALSQMFANPGGSLGYYMHGGYNYAHNLWLDAGLRGGVIPFVLLLIIGFRILKDTFRIVKKKLFDPFETRYLVALCIVMFAQAMMEPVIEGLFQYFLLIIFFYGCVSSLKRRNVSESLESTQTV